MYIHVVQPGGWGLRGLGTTYKQLENVFLLLGPPKHKKE